MSEQIIIKKAIYKDNIVHIEFDNVSSVDFVRKIKIKKMKDEIILSLYTTSLSFFKKRSVINLKMNKLLPIFYYNREGKKVKIQVETFSDI
ncbi:MAG: hypothetical protein HFJ09_03710 [Lachnospiraceae bacterium]|nr:hypothetical protein [Lachnospiraceae bacterium]